METGSSVLKRGDMYCVDDSDTVCPTELSEVRAKTRKPFVVVTAPIRSDLAEYFTLLRKRPHLPLDAYRYIITRAIQRVCVCVYLIALAINIIRVAAIPQGVFVWISIKINSAAFSAIAVNVFRLLVIMIDFPE